MPCQEGIVGYMFARKGGTTTSQAGAHVRFAPVSGPGAQLGESPFWDHGDHVWWVDIGGRRLLRTRLSTGAGESWPTPEIPGFVVLTGPRQAAVGMESGIFSFSPEAGTFERIVGFAGEGQRFNDATVDGSGRLWASTMAVDGARGRGALHLVSPDMTLKPVMDGLTTPNGLAADLGRGRLFISDSHPDIRMIWTAGCDFGTGEIGQRVEFASTAKLAGRPDGAALSTKGDIYWIAGVDGAELYGFARDGRLEHVVPVPFPAPTKLAFFGGGVAVTAKGEGGYGGQIAVATGVPSILSGPAVPFWQPRGATAMQ